MLARPTFGEETTRIALDQLSSPRIETLPTTWREGGMPIQRIIAGRQTHDPIDKEATDLDKLLIVGALETADITPDEHDDPRDITTRMICAPTMRHLFRQWLIHNGISDIPPITYDDPDHETVIFSGLSSPLRSMPEHKTFTVPPLTREEVSDLFMIHDEETLTALQLATGFDYDLLLAYISNNKIATMLPQAWAPVIKRLIDSRTYMKQMLASFISGNDLSPQQVLMDHWPLIAEHLLLPTHTSNGEPRLSMPTALVQPIRQTMTYLRSRG
jgi:hypothetical protein